MSEGGGELVKNGDVAALPESDQMAQSEVKCPEVDFSPYDEHGRPKPFIAICPPRLPDPVEPAVETAKNGPGGGDGVVQSAGEAEKPVTKEEPKTNGTKVEKSDSKEQQPKTNGTSEPAKEPKSPTASADQKSQNKSFSEQFKLFSKFGDTKSDGRLLSLSQSDKWMKQAKVIDGKHITTTDTGIHFKKLK